MSKPGNDIHHLLDNLIRIMLMEIHERPDDFAFKEKVSFVSAAGMYLTRDQKLRSVDDTGRAGSKVRSYSGAFRTPTNATGGRKPNARPAAADPDDDSDSES